MTRFLHGMLALALCLIVPATLFAGDSGYGVMYDGGSLPGVKTGSKVKMYIESNQIRFVQDGKDLVVLPAASVTEISYGQDVHRRVGAAVGVAIVSFGVGALLALSKSKKHFVGIAWANGDQKGASPCSATRAITAAFWPASRA